MGFIKMLIGLPLLIVIMIFAFVNNDLATFNLWPFYLEITVSLSVAILFFLFCGFLLGSLFTWMSYAPLRKDLKKQKKKNKKLSKEQLKLVATVSDLKENLEQIKAETKVVEQQTKKTILSFLKFWKKEPNEETVDNNVDGNN